MLFHKGQLKHEHGLLRQTKHTSRLLYGGSISGIFGIINQINYKRDVVGPDQNYQTIVYNMRIITQCVSFGERNSHNLIQACNVSINYFPH